MHKAVWLALTIGLGVAGAQGERAMQYLTSEAPPPPTPIYDHGYLIFFYGTHSSEFAVYGVDGTRAFRAQLTSPFATAPCAHSAAADTDGTIAVSAGCSGPPHDMGGSITLLDKTGKQIRFIRTGRYMPVEVTFGVDHGVWTEGWQRDTDDVYSEDKKSYEVFREYSREGQLMREYIPKGMLPHGFSSSVVLGEKSMAVARERVGALGYGGGRERMWVEFDYDGKLLGTWPMGDLPIGNIALTYDGHLYRYARGGKSYLTGSREVGRRWRARFRRIGA
jgi:hypothetical protein